MYANIFLLMGSNLGDAAANIVAATTAIGKFAGKVEQKSSLYATEAWGKTDQPDFINQVLRITSNLSPEALLESLLKIETQLGRARSEKWGPRTIDIDVLFYGDVIIKSARLTIPHPAIAERRFTLVPLAEIAPDFIHPVLNKTVELLLEECSDPLEVRKV